MDEQRFDSWTRALAQNSGTRRTIVQAAAAGLTAAAMGVLGLEQAVGKKGKGKKKKKKKKPSIPAAANPDPICAGFPSCCSPIADACGAGCNCQTTIEGGGFCYKRGALACGASCTSSAECPDGVCIFYGTATTCGQNHCCEDRPAVCVPNSSRCDAPSTCISQSTCGPNCRCFFDVEDALACYDLDNQSTCCDSNAECGQDEGCVKGACGGGGGEAGRCFAFCNS